MKISILIPGVTLAIGLGVGFGIGSSGKSVDDEITAAEAQIRTRLADRGQTRPVVNEKKARSVEGIYRKPGQSNRVQALLDYYSNLSPDQFSLEAEKLDSLPFNERILASFLLFGKWAEVDPQAAMAFTDTMGFTGAFVRPTVLQGWASVDPVNAAQYYTKNPSQFAMMNMMGGRGRGRMSAQGPGEIIAGEWAKQDSTAAMEWASGLKINKDQAMTSVISEVAKIDPMKAAEMANSMEAESRGTAYESIAKLWGAKNFSEASAWAAGLPEAERNKAISAAIEGLAQTSPELAATEIGKMTDLDARRNAVPIVAKNYARADLQGSITWLNTLDDAAKRGSMRDVMPIWTSSNPAAALDFVKSQTSPEVKNSAAESYIWSNRAASPSDLVEVVGMISNESSKIRTTGMIASRWMQEDEAGAKEFINSSDLISAGMKEQLLSGQPFWGGGRGR